MTAQVSGFRAFEIVFERGYGVALGVVQRSGLPSSSTISEPQSKDFCDCLRIVE